MALQNIQKTGSGLILNFDNLDNTLLSNTAIDADYFKANLPWWNSHWQKRLFLANTYDLGGDDEITGLNGNDFFEGGGGNDKIHGNGGKNTLIGDSLAAIVATGANLVLNGSFESFVDTGSEQGGFRVIGNAANESLTNWTVTGPAAEVVMASHGRGSAPDETWWLDMALHRARSASRRA
jgi:Ca2+-binding RTX toxin-like protein